MNKKVLAILITIIVVICGIAIYFSYFSNSSPDKKTSINDDDSAIELKGNKTTINGLTCMIPNSYSNGTIKKSPGIETYGTYESDSIYITVYDNSKQGDKVYQGDIDYFAYGIANEDKSLKRENITINNHKILYVSQHSETRGDYRLVFFEVHDKKVLIEWLGSEITPDIKNIIYSFYELNLSHDKMS